jgi:hypothetical protein
VTISSNSNWNALPLGAAAVDEDSARHQIDARGGVGVSAVGQVVVPAMCAPPALTLQEAQARAAVVLRACAPYVELAVEAAPFDGQERHFASIAARRAGGPRARDDAGRSTHGRRHRLDQRRLVVRPAAACFDRRGKLGVAVRSGHLGGREPPIRHGTWIRPGVHQRAGDARVPVCRRAVERRPTIDVVRVDPSACYEEVSHEGRFVVPRELHGPVQDGLSERGGVVQVRATREQQLDTGEVLALGGDGERRHLQLALGLDVRAAIEQQRHDGDVAILRGLVEGRALPLASSIDVGTAIQQRYD